MKTFSFLNHIYSAMGLCALLSLFACGGGGGSSAPTPSPSLPPSSASSISSAGLSSSTISLSSSSVSLSSNSISLSSSALSVSNSAISISSLAASFSSSSSSASSISSSAASAQPKPEVPVVTLTYGIKQIQLAWPSINGATFYRVMKSLGRRTGYTQIGGDLVSPNFTDTVAVHLTDWINLSYMVSACNSSGCTDSTPINGLDSTKAIGYFKASNLDPNDKFGTSIAISGDGNTLAVGAISEDGAIPVANPTIGDLSNAASGTGAVYVFTRVNGLWVQQAYLKASNAEAGDNFGVAVSLSNDGNTLAVGADKEDSDANTINGSQSSNLATDSGAVYVFNRNGNSWSVPTYIKGSHKDDTKAFGFSLSISGDGNTLAVGAPHDQSGLLDVDSSVGGKVPATVADSGAVYVFNRSAGNWQEFNYIKASVTSDVNDQFGYSVALSNDGRTLAVGAINESSTASWLTAVPINQVDQSDNSATGAGAVYVLTRGRQAWAHQAFFKAPVPDVGDQFGYSVALSSSGNELAVGAPTEDSKAQGINALQEDNSSTNSGAVYTFSRTVNAWSYESYIKASNTPNPAQTNPNFGKSVALSADGLLLAVGSPNEIGLSVGVNGDENFVKTTSGSGAVYCFSRIVVGDVGNGTWSPKSYVKASNTDGGDRFGNSVALSTDGNTLAVGASDEDGDAEGVGGNQASDQMINAGAVYLY